MWRKWYGVSLKGVTDIFISLGCDDAMNFDGGGSISVIRKVGSFFKYGNRKVGNMVGLFVERW